jgi:hypothetical protein
MCSRQGSNESQEQQSAPSFHRCGYQLVKLVRSTANGSFHVILLRRQESYNAAPEVQVRKLPEVANYPSGELP